MPLFKEHMFEFKQGEGFQNLDKLTKYLGKPVIVDYRKGANFNEDTYKTKHPEYGGLTYKGHQGSFSIHKHLIDKEFRAFVVQIARLGCGNENGDFLLYVSDKNIPRLGCWVNCDYDQIVREDKVFDCPHDGNGNQEQDSFHGDTKLEVCDICGLHYNPTHYSTN